MPLTHVSMWTNRGMLQATPDQAISEYGRMTIPASAELFLCDLCNQYVTLVVSKYQKSHFRHSSSDNNKNCEERSKNISNFYSIKKKQLETLDFRLNIEKKCIELIIPSIEFTSLSEDKYLIINNILRFNFERFSQLYPSYIKLPLNKKYSIKFDNCPNSVYDYFPNEIKGFDNTAVFDGKTYKKLHEYSEITIDKYYYVLTCDYKLLNNCINQLDSIFCEDIRCNFIEEYHLFKIKVTSLNRYTFSFILKYLKLKLNDILPELYPIWPPCINAPYKVYHNSPKIFMYLSCKGNYVMLKSYPENGIIQKTYDEPTIIPILCSEREYLFTMGRNTPWQQLYIKKDNLTQKNKINTEIQIRIIDVNGTEFQPGIYHNLPKKGEIKIEADYDGKVVIRKNGSIVRICKIKSGMYLSISNIIFGTDIAIYQGLDCVCNIQFLRVERNEDFNKEAELYSKLNKIRGNEIEIPHTLRAIISKISVNSKLKQWLYQKMKLGRMSFKALKLIKQYLLER